MPFAEQIARQRLVHLLFGRYVFRVAACIISKYLALFF